ncbi:MAG TPA: hypothetical protein VHY79_06265 [Rhizomicrobium sp.]|jgi:hypothetical protein|nr:hypothetical protein [Rhizomicrobium sp.]
MFKNGLLATTAIVVVGTFSFVAAQSAALARPATAGLERDKNREFLCSYGSFAVSGYNFRFSSSYFVSGWTHVAVPIVGRGQTVKSITVGEARGSHTHGAEFTAGIYSNSASGSPGAAISVGRGKAPKSCRRVNVPIAPTTLERGTTYWVEETVALARRAKGGFGDRPHAQFFWAVNPRTTHKAYVQSGSYSSASNGGFSTSWIAQSQGPYFKLK